MTPGWRRVCSCGKAELDHFCQGCMAFRSEVTPFFGVSRCECEGQCQGRARLHKTQFCGLVGERGRRLDSAEVAKATTRRVQRGGTLGH